MNADNRKKMYSSILLREVPRLLSLMDREPFSTTYGCLDRTYWNWKFIDFSCSRFQEAALSLTIAYIFDFEGNIYHKNENLLEWIIASIKYWCGSQRRDGSFDEAYPGEKSFVAVGFSLFCVTESVLLLRENGIDILDQQLISTLKKSIEFLSKTTETHAFITNHRAGTACGLYNCYLLLKDEEPKRLAEELLDSILNNQSQEGWFSEYKGADPGYETQGLYYLSMLYKKTDNIKLKSALLKSIEFLSYFVHPDHSIGGEYGRRHTDFYFSCGLEILGNIDSTALRIAEFMAEGIENANAPAAPTLDFYNSIPNLNSIALSLLHFVSENSTSKLPCENDGEFLKCFIQSGFVLKKTKAYYAIFSRRKGGAINAYSLDGKKVFYSMGYVAKHKNKCYTNLWWNMNELSTDVYSIVQNMNIVNRHQLTQIKNIGIRIVSFVTKYSIGLNKLLKKVIVASLIDKSRLLNAELNRKVEFNDVQIVIYDKILNIEPDTLIWELPKFTSYHMGSSKYFSKKELYIPNKLTPLKASADGVIENKITWNFE